MTLRGGGMDIFCNHTFTGGRERRRQFIDQLQRSLEPTVHLCPQEGSPMDSQSKPRRNVVNCREFRNDQGRTTF